MLSDRTFLRDVSESVTRFTSRRRPPPCFVKSVSPSGRKAPHYRISPQRPARRSTHLRPRAGGGGNGAGRVAADTHKASARVPQLKMLWVNVGEGGPTGVSRIPFERLFELTDATPVELEDPGLARTWDAICFDFDYPDMSALNLIPAAKARWPSAPILMLTLQSSSDLAVWALRSRVFDLLIKPAVGNEVEHMLERVVAALRARRLQVGRKPQAVAAQPPVETRYHARPRGAPRLQAALAHVAKHFRRQIPESEVALLCNMSPSRFCREFRAAFAVTFVEYLAHYRVSQAKRLLANPAMPVADVAVAVGFNDPSYFTRVFRKQEHLSPSEYRAAATCTGITPRKFALP